MSAGQSKFRKIHFDGIDSVDLHRCAKMIDSSAKMLQRRLHGGFVEEQWENLTHAQISSAARVAYILRNLASIFHKQDRDLGPRIDHDLSIVPREIRLQRTLQILDRLGAGTAISLNPVIQDIDGPVSLRDLARDAAASIRDLQPAPHENGSVEEQVRQVAAALFDTPMDGGATFGQSLINGAPLAKVDDTRTALTSAWDVCRSLASHALDAIRWDGRKAA